MIFAWKKIFVLFSQKNSYPLTFSQDGTDCSAAVSVQSEFGSFLNQNIAIDPEVRRICDLSFLIFSFGFSIDSFAGAQ